jgi:hypothetical protein
MIIQKKRLRRASFRGAWFFLNETSTESGRRAVRLELPFQDKPIAQDFGKRGQTILIHGFVIGANYRSDTEKLLKACEEKGIGELFHPYYGTRKVICTNCRVNENSIEGGIVHFSLCFFETVDTTEGHFGLKTNPILGALLGSELLSSASDLLDKGIDLANEVPTELDNVNDAILSLAENIERIFSPLIHTKDSIDNLAASLSELRKASYQAYYHSTTGIKNAVLNFWAVVSGEKPTLDPYNWRRTFGPYRWNLQESPVARIDLAYKAFILGVQSSHVLSNMNEFSEAEKREQLQVLKSNIDSVLEIAENDPIFYHRLKRVQSACISILFETAINSKPINQIKTNLDQCLILESYYTFGDLSRVDKILDRYTHRHTCFGARE